jgi:putative flippase GtrA
MRKQFIRFSLIGVLGFIVDAGVLYLCLHIVGLGLYVGRFVSYLAAATTTWYLNRRLTFSEGAMAPPTWQWVKFISSNGLGGLINYGIYVLVVTLLPRHLLTPLLGIALGSIAGLGFNFTLSRHFVFAPSLRK